MTSPPPVLEQPMTTTERPPRTTSTVALRKIPTRARRIPVERRHLLTAPCDLCGDVATVQFDDGLCEPCRGVQEAAASADRVQDQAGRREGWRL